MCFLPRHTTFIWHPSCHAEPCLDPGPAIRSSLFLLAMGLRHRLCVFIQDANKRVPRWGVHGAQAVPELSTKARPHTQSSPCPRLPPRAVLHRNHQPSHLFRHLPGLKSHSLVWSLRNSMSPLCSDVSSSVFSVITRGLGATVGSTAGQLQATIQPGLPTPSLGEPSVHLLCTLLQIS